jgi:hypothetical protein
MPPGLEPLEALESIDERPILLVHGRADEIVPYAHAERLASASGENVTLVSIDEGRHNDLRWVDPTLDARVIDFFDRHLRDAAPADVTRGAGRSVR